MLFKKMERNLFGIEVPDEEDRIRQITFPRSIKDSELVDLIQYLVFKITQDKNSGLGANIELNVQTNFKFGEPVFWNKYSLNEQG